MRLIDADVFEKNMDKEFAIVPDPLYAVDKALEETPTIEAEPVRHGRWIPLEYDGYADGSPVWDLWECSECQEEHSGDEDTLTPYCPNCGARMDGDPE